MIRKPASTCFSMLIFTQKAILRWFLENIKHGKSAVPDLWTLSLFFPYLAFILYILYKIHIVKNGESQRFTISNLKSAQVTLDYTSQFKNSVELSFCKCTNDTGRDVATDRWKILSFQDFDCSVNLEYCKMVTKCFKVLQLKCGISVVKNPTNQQKTKEKNVLID